MYSLSGQLCAQGKVLLLQKKGRTDIEKQVTVNFIYIKFHSKKKVGFILCILQKLYYHTAEINV